MTASVMQRKPYVTEVRAIEFNDGGRPRRWFRVHFERPQKRVSVVAGGLLPVGKMLCADHGIDEACECKAAVLDHMKSDLRK